MTDVTIISYLLPANLSSQQSREGQTKVFFSSFSFSQRCRLWTIGGSVLPQKGGYSICGVFFVRIQPWQRKAWGCSSDLIRQKQILTCSFLCCLPSISLQSAGVGWAGGVCAWGGGGGVGCGGGALRSNCNFNCERRKKHTFIAESQVLRPCFTPPRGNHYSR